MRTVLVVEDEPVIRTAMIRGLSRLPEVRVVEAATVGEAARALGGGEVDLLVSDIDLPDGSAVALLEEMSRLGKVVPTVFISAHLAAFAPSIPAHPDIETHEKPVSLERLREIVSRRLRGRPLDTGGASGTLPFTAPDFFQLACIGRHSVRIERRDGERLVGYVVVVEGIPWAAEDEVGSGEPAFRRVMFSGDGAVRCRGVARDPGRRNLDKTSEELLLESARLVDEEEAHEAPLRASLAEPEAVPEAPARTFETLWDEGVAALLAKDYRRARDAFVAAQELNPSDWRVAVNLRRLSRLLGEDGTGSEDGQESKENKEA